MADISLEIELITAGRPELTFPHTMAQRINPGWKRFGYLVKISITLVEHTVVGTARILITLPPAHGKTLLIIYYIIWYLNLYPSRTVIFATHTTDILIVRLAVHSTTASRLHVQRVLILGC